jgi:hypothetical protein
MPRRTGVSERSSKGWFLFRLFLPAEGFGLVEVGEEMILRVKSLGLDEQAFKPELLSLG